MIVILLCAGYATRLYPLTKNQPKPLLPVADRPLIEHILDRLKMVGEIERVFVVTNHQFAGHFEKWAANVKYPWPIGVVDDLTTTNETRRGAIGDLDYVLKANSIRNKDILVIAGDNLFSFDLAYFTEWSRKKRPKGVIAVYDVKDFHLAKQYGIVNLSPDGRVTEFLEKPEKPPTTLASCGIYWLPAETIVLLEEYLGGGHNADQPGHYMRWLAENKSLFAVPLEGMWYDIGDLASYHKAKLQFAGIS